MALIETAVHAALTNAAAPNPHAAHLDAVDREDHSIRHRVASSGRIARKTRDWFRS